MPIYEYQCKKCSQVTEAIQKFSDPPLTKCPQCGGRLNKMMSLNAFHLKGQGWYVTDYKGKNSSSAATGSEGGAETKDSSKKKTKDQAEKKPKAEKSDT